MESMILNASSVRQGNAAATATNCPSWKRFSLQLSLAVLLFLAPFSDGFAVHRFQEDPSARLQITLFQSSSSTLSIDSKGGGQSSLDRGNATENDSLPQPTKARFTSSEAARHSSDPNKKIPVHLLAGFLGSGKTTTLKHVLENKQDVRVGVIVNDVASVNIDAKLISRAETNKQQEKEIQSKLAKGGSEVIELQNGCACCSLAGELFDSIGALLQARTETATQEKSAAVAAYDAILVELSGVADPVAIQNNWKEAIQKESNTLVTESSQLGNVVTIVDATTFGSDYMTFDILKDRDEWFENNANSENDNGSNPKQPHSLNRQVVELLAEQVEAAHLIVVNKEDLAGHEKVEVTKTMAQSLNQDARVLVTSHGRIPAKELLGLTVSRDLDREENFDEKDVDSSHNHSHDHRQEASNTHSHSHSHSNSNSHDHNASDDPDVMDESYSHSHSHDHAKCDNANCTDPSHNHSHSHDHAKCDDPDCTDPSHDHSHSHDHSTCDDVNCTDPSHDHSHSHDHGQTMTSTANLGISSFVYKATRPFEPKRLRKLLFDWPIPIKGELDFDLLNDALKTGYGIDADKSAAGEEEEATTSEAISPFVGVLRSKGFCWIAPTAWEGLLADPWRHDTAMYWSHAGKHFGLQPGGSFWDSLPRSALENFFEASPDPKAAINKILTEDFVTEEFGDRRQELVFIGVSLRRQDIEAALDGCLLTDSEMEDYRKQLVLSKDYL